MERRQSDRLQIPRLDEVLLRNREGASSLCRIHDISPFGMRFEFAPSSPLAAETGTNLVVDGCPDALQAMLLNQQCQVVWRRGRECGARFNTPLRFSLPELGEVVQYVQY